MVRVQRLALWALLVLLWVLVLTLGLPLLPVVPGLRNAFPA